MVTSGLTQCIYAYRVCSVIQPCLIFYNLINCSLPDSSVHEISQARILEWLPFPPPGDPPNPGIEPASPVSPALAGGFFTTEPPGKSVPEHHIIKGYLPRTIWYWSYNNYPPVEGPGCFSIMQFLFTMLILQLCVS